MQEKLEKADLTLIPFSKVIWGKTWLYRYLNLRNHRNLALSSVFFRYTALYMKLWLRFIFLYSLEIFLSLQQFSPGAIVSTRLSYDQSPLLLYGPE